MHFLERKTSAMLQIWGKILNRGYPEMFLEKKVRKQAQYRVTMQSVLV